MQNNLSQDSIKNNETLNYLTDLIEKLILSNALIGRNESMFAVNADKVSQDLFNGNNDLKSLFNNTKLIYSQGKSFGSTYIFSGTYDKNDKYFFSMDQTVNAINGEKEEYLKF